MLSLTGSGIYPHVSYELNGYGNHKEKNRNDFPIDRFADKLHGHSVESLTGFLQLSDFKRKFSEGVAQGCGNRTKGESSLL
jgi:hypothetical protein